MRDEDRITPYNGHSYRGPDILANGCAWLVGIAATFIAVFGLYGFWADRWK
jgi:hypothetical protein